jgi:hypothetical protein
VGLIGLGLFFGAHLIVGLAGWEEMILIAAGLVLVALEVFVIPGFGVAGALGIMALGAGLVMSMLGRFHSIRGDRCGDGSDGSVRIRVPEASEVEPQAGRHLLARGDD